MTETEKFFEIAKFYNRIENNSTHRNVKITVIDEFKRCLKSDASKVKSKD